MRTNSVSPASDGDDMLPNEDVVVVVLEIAVVLVFVGLIGVLFLCN